MKFSKSLRLALGVAMSVGVTQGFMSAADAAVTNFPDSTASFNGEVDSVVYHNGVIYVGGEFTAAIQGGQSIARNHVAAIDETTGNVLAWNPNANGDVDSIAVTDSATYLGGTFTKVGGASHTHVASVATAGSGAVNAGFTGSASAGPVRAVAVTGSTLYVGGHFQVADGVAKPDLAAFNSQTGALLSGFSATPDSTVRAIAPANGQLYVGGQFKTMDGSGRDRFFASVDPSTGALQNSWNSPVNFRVMKIVATPTAIYAAADGPGGHLVATNLNGTQQWVATTDGGDQALTLVNNTIYVGGHFDNVCTTPRTGAKGDCVDGEVQRKKFAAFDLSGNLTSWAPQADSALGAFTMDSDPATGRIAAGGVFTSFNFGRISQPSFAQWG